MRRSRLFCHFDPCILRIHPVSTCACSHHLSQLESRLAPTGHFELEKKTLDGHCEFHCLSNRGPQELSSVGHERMWVVCDVERSPTEEKKPRGFLHEVAEQPDDAGGFITLGRDWSDVIAETLEASASHTKSAVTRRHRRSWLVALVIATCVQVEVEFFSKMRTLLTRARVERSLRSLYGRCLRQCLMISGRREKMEKSRSCARDDHDICVCTSSCSCV